ncbi:hypothetical protein QBC42DRAFT_283420 [Cladorrhinum samala]|uniref:Uncharacterized protein n=1 Tax=Cladorrhinum samala TaxID=585594 RepID=A0AAV9I0K6_9PEZI|nr:hypothetical protein QBC42DRAFT_283420 [Cladorrhinum samala]
MAFQSPLSEAATMRRQSIISIIQSLPQGQGKSEQSLVEELISLQPALLAGLETRKFPRLSAEFLHWTLDASLLRKTLGNDHEQIAAFLQAFPRPDNQQGKSCIEYAPYRARVRALLKGKSDLPDHFWQQLGFTDCEDLCIERFSVKISIDLAPSLDALVPSCSPNPAEPWFPSVVCVRGVKEADHYRVTLFRHPSAPESLDQRAFNSISEAWRDILGWRFDLCNGNNVNLVDWVARSQGKQAASVQSEGLHSTPKRIVGMAALRRQAINLKVDRQYPAAIGAFNQDVVPLFYAGPVVRRSAAEIADVIEER